MGFLSEFFRRLPTVEVHQHVERRQFKGKDGKPDFERREQVGYLIQVDQYGVETRRRIRIPLDRDAAPYPVGYAVVDGQSFNGNQWGDIELVKYGLCLTPVPAQVLQLVESDSKRAAA